MLKQKKVPMRKCVVTNEQYPKKELIRIVKNKEGAVFVDLTGKQNGRGAYMILRKDVIEKAKKTKILNKYLETDVPEDIYTQLLGLIETADK